MTTLKMAQEWQGVSEEGLPFEIRFWGEPDMCDGHGMWNYYVYLYEAQFRPEDWVKIWLPVGGWHEWASGKRPWYDYYNSALSVDNWHGGITFFEKEIRGDTEEKRVKIGCDYGHSFDRDRGYMYNVDYVEQEARATCKSLAEYLKPLIRDAWSGKFYEPKDVFKVEGFSGWMSQESIDARAKYATKRLERYPDVRSAVVGIVKRLEGE